MKILAYLLISLNLRALTNRCGDCYDATLVHLEFISALTLPFVYLVAAK